MNNKGFTFVEILAAVVILGVLGVIATTATIKYLSSSRSKAYVVMSESLYHAAENCIIAEKCDPTKEITGTQLISNNYMKDLKNPKKDNESCTARITVSSDKSNTGNKNVAYNYLVTLSCNGIVVEGYKDGVNTIKWPVPLSGSISTTSGSGPYAVTTTKPVTKYTVSDIIKMYKIRG